MSEAVPQKAVLYLRVSSQRQTKTAIDIDPDGNSIATQREAAVKKAASLGVEVAETFVEPGVSAKTVEKRPVFREMLDYLKSFPDVDYVIVYARSRAFRNYVDAAITKRQLDQLGVKLLSVREDFGEGIFADAMEGMLDIFNQMQNDLSAQDVKTKMRHKAINGGTIGRARLGYLNVRREIDGHLINTIDIDPERGPLVRRGFELYATGDYTLNRLADTMEDLGLTARPSPRHPQRRPVTLKKWHRMLSDPYYAGYIIHDGEQYPGRHEALVSHELFSIVQNVLAARSKGGTRDRVHHHYLRGLLACDRCRVGGRDSRLVFVEANGRGGQYQYFTCAARLDGGRCDLPYLPAWQVEDAVIDHFATIEPPLGWTAAMEREITELLDDEQRTVHELRAAATKKLAEFDAQEEHFLDLLADDSLPLEKIRGRLRKLQIERDRVETQRRSADKQLAAGAEALLAAIKLIAHPQRTYLHAEDQVRRDIAAAIFHRFYFNEHGQLADSDLQPAFEHLVGAFHAFPGASDDVDMTKGLDVAVEAPESSDSLTLSDLLFRGGSNRALMVREGGFEPPDFPSFFVAIPAWPSFFPAIPAAQPWSALGVLGVFRPRWANVAHSACPSRPRVSAPSGRLAAFLGGA